MFGELSFRDGVPVSLQIKEYIRGLILSGMLRGGEKLPSTRELGSMLGVSRNSVMRAYEELEDDGFLYSIESKGSFVQDVRISAPAGTHEEWKVDWTSRKSGAAVIAEQFDIIRNTVRTGKDVISFRGISPDRELSDVEGIKRAFLNILSKEGQNILNYGYAKGYKPLGDYLLQYMRSKGIDTEGKDIIITNGFTEGFDIVLSTVCEEGDSIVCENPTHNTAIKIMKLHGLKIHGADMEHDGISLEKLEAVLDSCKPRLGYMVPSYHNPTGIVMSPEKRIGAYEIFRRHGVPVVEDGFNEELRYSGAHIPPIAALCGKGNGMIYIGSFSKILFPGIRLGWILADRELVSTIESVKKSRNIHTSFLDQAVLYEYLYEGNLERCIKKSRRVYGERYKVALDCAKRYIPHESMSGDGGMYIFVKLGSGIDTEELLLLCREKGVIFMPGRMFYTDGRGGDTMRLSFANVKSRDIEEGFRIIGETVRELTGEKGQG